MTYMEVGNTDISTRLHETSGLPVIRPELSAAVLADRRTLTGGVKARGCQRRQACVWMVFALLNGIVTCLGRR
jgi:hypothetical protein